MDRLYKHKYQHGWTCAQLSLFFGSTKESNTCVHVFFARMHGSVHDRQPTVILQASFQMRKKKRESEREKSELNHANL